VERDAAFAAVNTAAMSGAEGLWNEAEAETRRRQCGVVREVFGNPFRPVAIDPTWQTPDVVALAGRIYHDRRFDRMPELADTLEDAGCTDADLLGHPRGPGPHARGCWALDLLL
jgi:hypothetical protein